MGSGAGGHGNQTLTKGLHAPITWKFPDAAARTAFTPSAGLPGLASQLDADDIDKWALQEDDGTFWRLTVVSPLTWVRVNLNAFPHADTHQDGGTDPLDVRLLDGFSGNVLAFLRDDGTFAVPNGRGLLGWGNGSIAATTTTRYLTPWYEDSTAPTAPIRYRATRAGFLGLMRVHHGGPAGNGNTIVYTLRVNGVATAVTVSMASTAADGSDLVNAVAVAAGDLLDIEVTKAASIGATPTDVSMSLEFV